MPTFGIANQESSRIATVFTKNLLRRGALLFLASQSKPMEQYSSTCPHNSLRRHWKQKILCGLCGWASWVAAGPAIPIDRIRDSDRFLTKTLAPSTMICWIDNSRSIKKRAGPAWMPFWYASMGRAGFMCLMCVIAFLVMARNKILRKLLFNSRVRRTRQIPGQCHPSLNKGGAQRKNLARGKETI